MSRSALLRRGFVVCTRGYLLGGLLIEVDPTKLVVDSIRNNKPMIFISINYRLNVFGFGDGKEKNLGLKDQRLGIEWVRRNIASFGGDPVCYLFTKIRSLPWLTICRRMSP